MKKALLSVAIVLALAVAVQAHPVAVEPTSLLTATPGEVFVVHGIALNAPASDRVEGVNFEIYFDPTLVQVLGWNEGDFMAQQHPEMPWGFTTVDNSLGIVSLTLVRLGSKYSSGSGTGASVTFQGETYEHTDVAEFMTRLGLLPQLTNIQLSSSTKAAATGTTGTTGPSLTTFTVTASLRRYLTPPPTTTAVRAPARSGDEFEELEVGSGVMVPGSSRRRARRASLARRAPQSHQSSTSRIVRS